MLPLANRSAMDSDPPLARAARWASAAAACRRACRPAARAARGGRWGAGPPWAAQPRRTPTAHAAQSPGQAAAGAAAAGRARQPPGPTRRLAARGGRPARAGGLGGGVRLEPAQQVLPQAAGGLVAGLNHLHARGGALEGGRVCVCV
jgi:hypothetical protein